ncbi:hypothetical protein BDW60DRAFT_172487 [Aspergillus nidulans var. acristatus]
MSRTVYHNLPLLLLFAILACYMLYPLSFRDLPMLQPVNDSFCRYSRMLAVRPEDWAP